MSSSLVLPNPAIPGRRPSMVLITDQLILMKHQRNLMDSNTELLVNKSNNIDEKTEGHKNEKTEETRETYEKIRV